MPTLYWGPWLAKIRRGGPVYKQPIFYPLQVFRELGMYNLATAQLSYVLRWKLV